MATDPSCVTTKTRWFIGMAYELQNLTKACNAVVGMTLGVDNAVNVAVPPLGASQVLGMGTEYPPISWCLESWCAMVPQLSNPKRTLYTLLRANATEVSAT